MISNEKDKDRMIIVVEIVQTFITQTKQ